jgi:Holliday junction resolvasome RuvABC ATP-dependent DNA helicase subunit
MRPQRYSEIVGQDDLVTRLKAFSDFHLKNSSTAGHVLILGEEGTGKGTIAGVFARELGLHNQELDASKLELIADLTVVITNFRDDEALILQEVHRLKRALQERLTEALRTQKLVITIGVGTAARTHAMDVATFTLIATATKKSDCIPDLLNCFSLVLPLQPYSNDALAQLAGRIAAHANIEIDSESSRLIAINSGGRLHRLEVLMQRVARAVKKQRITADDTLQALSAFGMSVRTSASSDNGPEIANMSGVEFERLVTTLLARMGFRAEMTKATGDGGIDIVAVLDKPIIGGKYLFQCKRYGPGNVIGASIVRDFYGAVTADRAVKGILVTTSDFTIQAREFAERVGVELINLSQLQNLLGEHRTT